MQEHWVTVNFVTHCILLLMIMGFDSLLNILMSFWFWWFCVASLVGHGNGFQGRGRETERHPSLAASGISGADPTGDGGCHECCWVDALVVVPWIRVHSSGKLAMVDLVLFLLVLGFKVTYLLLQRRYYKIYRYICQHVYNTLETQ